MQLSLRVLIARASFGSYVGHFGPFLPPEVSSVSDSSGVLTFSSLTAFGNPMTKKLADSGKEKGG